LALGAGDFAGAFAGRLAAAFFFGADAVFSVTVSTWVPSASARARAASTESAV
jgi:hypothetical protein